MVWDESQQRQSAVEKRRHVRVAAALGVSFSIAGGAAPASGRAVTRDISHGGACLALRGCSEELFARLAEFPLLDIVIDGLPSSFQARVEWLRPPVGQSALAMIGLEFSNLTATDETVIIDLIAHLLISTNVTSSTDPHPTPQTGRVSQGRAALRL